MSNEFLCAAAWLCYSLHVGIYRVKLMAREHLQHNRLLFMTRAHSTYPATKKESNLSLLVRYYLLAINLPSLANKGGIHPPTPATDIQHLGGSILQSLYLSYSHLNQRALAWHCRQRRACRCCCNSPKNAPVTSCSSFFSRCDLWRACRLGLGQAMADKNQLAALLGLPATCSIRLSAFCHRMKLRLIH